MLIIIFLYLYLATNNYYIVDARITSISQDQEDLDLERQLKLINKPPRKTIQANGYIVDCIDINKQPAFDNPLLKNHKIQLKPSFEVTSIESTRLSSIGIEEDLCPAGTVPIRRTTKDDLIRAKQLPDKNISILNNDIPGRHYAGLKLNKDGSHYFAISGIIDTYNLPVQNPDQITSAYIYLSNGGSENDKNVIMTGWEDPETKNWWVMLQNKSLGYYPEVLFSNLAFANLGGWTGMTSTPTGIPSPPMGSGHLPDNNLLRSCYIRQMHFQIDTSKNLGPIKDVYAVPFKDSSCYGVQYEGWNDEIQGFAMLFGGPGGNCGE
ncbi:hypothetical protein TanjilG_06703 [Lupinus angustifolius]|uniref:Neprosin PEP catalytic domain-containing protein n=1 Tax=Lupinus angustifolius TaxID=3871 RepID=A0A1J7H5K9_LUPAN|nr:hypothetical protein TanjilG_06703 [Lupinus angustifolius]